MKTLVVYTDKEFDEKWPSAKFQSANSEQRVRAHRLKNVVDISNYGHYRDLEDRHIFEDAGEWRISVDSNSRPEDVDELIGLIQQAAQYAKEHP